MGPYFTKMKAQMKIQRKNFSLGFSQLDSKNKKCNTAFYGHCSKKGMHASTYFGEMRLLYGYLNVF